MRNRWRRRTGPAIAACHRAPRCGLPPVRRCTPCFDFRRLIDNRLAAVVQPDLTLCGGFEVARTIGVLCAAEHLRISPHVWGTGIGLAAALHFLAALPSYPHAEHVPFPPLLEYDVGSNRLQSDLFIEPVRFAEGHLDVPSGPGLGVTLDDAAVRRFSAG